MSFVMEVAGVTLAILDYTGYSAFLEKKISNQRELLHSWLNAGPVEGIANFFLYGPRIITPIMFVLIYIETFTETKITESLMPPPISWMFVQTGPYFIKLVFQVAGHHLVEGSLLTRIVLTPISLAFIIGGPLLIMYGIVWVACRILAYIVYWSLSAFLIILDKINHPQAGTIGTVSLGLAFLSFSEEIIGQLF